MKSDLGELHPDNVAKSNTKMVAAIIAFFIF
ncbi:hypothetical protein LMOf6854_2478 [Listeria monocytogenes str. 1/2a F6854]|nr:hypothetical protein LMOf6854_2478 [Listeria monocytogenes str. 1/2a F6854] [Listeria monocytogenes serotype 1/2a str. F6854]